MILTDVNVLVYAFRREASQHDVYAAWLRGAVAGAEEIALHDPVMSGFVRIVTNPRFLADPAPTAAALAFIDRLRGANRARWVPAGNSPWKVLRSWADEDTGIRGNLVPDAHLAATAVAHGCRLATADRGFARYPGLAWFDPARTA